MKKAMYGSKNKTLTHVLYVIFAVIAFLLGNQAVSLCQEVSQRTGDWLEIASYVLKQSTTLPCSLRCPAESRPAVCCC